MSVNIIPQDECWIKQAKKNLTDLYENRPLDRLPFEFFGFDIRDEFKPVHSAQPVVNESIENYRRDLLDSNFQLNAQLETISNRVRQGFWDDTVMALHPLSSATGWLTEVFSGKTVWFANRPPYPHPVITEARQIDQLRPDFASSELYQTILEQLRYFRKVVGDRLPIGAPDLQSPMDVASMIFDYTQIIYAMIDEPARVHSLMRMITDAMIKACHAFKKEMTNYPLSGFNWWIPKGIFLSDDLQSVLNAELYHEFAVPYNEALSEEFGGLATHSCGRILHNVENIVNTKGLIVFNTHDRLDKIAEIVKNRVAVIVGGLVEVIAPNHPECQRPFISDAEALEKLWWDDFEKLPLFKEQRFLYQCHALLCQRTAEEAYKQMMSYGKKN